MSTKEVWLKNNIILVTWTTPLTLTEVSISFNNLADMLNTTDERTNILFDIISAGAIPAQTPILAIKSKFLINKSVGKIAVVSEDPVAEILAGIATKVTKKEIKFFENRTMAFHYFNLYHYLTHQMRQSVVASMDRQPDV